MFTENGAAIHIAAAKIAVTHIDLILSCFILYTPRNKAFDYKF